jgi:3',5'-cyclic AMP phosphodiesterase CpdA
MRTIVHLSDLHFGSADRQLVDAIVETVHGLAPDVVAVSGDMTQRARRRQFLEARAFLDRLPQPQIVVPGNHDVPLYNVLARFASPLGAFRRYITRDLRPVHRDTDLLVVGANTTRAFTIKDGGLRPLDVGRVVADIGEAGADVLKVVVCHHPFDAPTSRMGRLTRPRVDAGAITTLVGAGADVLLTGHLHVSYTGGSAVRYRVPGRTAIIVEAGTAASTRVRGETNSFNVLRAERGMVAVERLAWDGQARRFALQQRQLFRRSDEGWLEDGVTTA